MKTIMKAGSLLAMIAVMTSSCSVERKTRSGKKNVIDVGMNQKEEKANQSDLSAIKYDRTVPATGR